jgi:hypothetical protein
MSYHSSDPTRMLSATVILSPINECHDCLFSNPYLSTNHYQFPISFDTIQAVTEMSRKAFGMSSTYQNEKKSPYKHVSGNI